jgi:S-adenosylmethionine:tRNA ribosyltransferase-isomerase
LTDAGASLQRYDYDLPTRCIAQVPPAHRRDARLLVWRADGGFEHRRVADLPAQLQAGDALVINDTRVFPARLLGTKRGGTARVEALLVRLRPLSGPEDRHGLQPPLQAWEAMVRPGRRLPPGSVVDLEGGLAMEVGADLGGARREVGFPATADVLAHAWRHGHVPLPPYIRRKDTAEDRARYQTVFARHDGSVAAPTAGLHLDAAMLAEIESRGVEVLRLCLHVGPGTFQPVTGHDVARGGLHPEAYVVPRSTVRAVRRRRTGEGRVIAVGTTVCRALESIDLERDAAQRGETTLFVRPGHRFQATDVLITNFHLPRSSLLMLVAALAGDRWRTAYELAVREGYRFYSYGDANWIEAGGAHAP